MFSDVLTFTQLMAMKKAVEVSTHKKGSCGKNKNVNHENGQRKKKMVE